MYRTGRKRAKRLEQFAALVVAVAVSIAILETVAVGQAARTGDVEVTAVGDILPARGVAERIRRLGDDYPFALVYEIFAWRDIAFGNLEAPLAKSCGESGKRYSFRGDPGFSRILARAGFDVVSIANNHSFDCGSEGLSETLDALGTAGLRTVGAGRDRDSALGATVIEIRGFRIGFLAFSAISPRPREAWPAVVAPAREGEIRDAVSDLRSSTDSVVVSIHWGTDYSTVPNSEQRALARTAVEAGADVVIGHHPHVLQGFEWARSPNGRHALIAYSLGDFVFDSPARLIPRTADSLVLNMRFGTGGLIGANIFPVVIEGYRPRPAPAKERARILTTVDRLSAEFSTRIAADGRIAPLRAVTRSVDLDSDGVAEQISFDPDRSPSLTVTNRTKANWSAVPANWNPWKLAVADVDGDGRKEIAVGIRKATRFFPEPHNCLFVYGWSARGGSPKWLGSSLGRPFTDFLFVDLDDRLGDELVALETKLSGRFSVAVYKWNGFGFTKDSERGDWRSAALVGTAGGEVEIDADGARIRVRVSLLRR
jgi:poly-gamma-glutamate synthesis protein (capsule biosynthesis protein)